MPCAQVDTPRARSRSPVTWPRSESTSTPASALRLTGASSLQAGSTSKQSAANSPARTQEFLFARLAVHEIQAAGRIPTGSDRERLLSSNHRDLFARAVHRLTDER